METLKKCFWIFAQAPIKNCIFVSPNNSYLQTCEWMDNGEPFYLQEVLLLPDDGGLQGGGILGGDLVLEVLDRATQVVVVLPELLRHLQRVLEVLAAGRGQLTDVVIQTHQLGQLGLYLCKQWKDNWRICLQSSSAFLPNSLSASQNIYFLTSSKHCNIPNPPLLFPHFPP